MIPGELGSVHLTAVSETFLSLLGRETLYSTAVLLVVVIAAWIARRAHPLLHLGLWALVFVRLVLPPGLGHPYSLASIATFWMERARSGLEIGESAPDGWIEEGPVGSPTAVGDLPTDGSMNRWPSALVVAWALGFVGLATLQWRRRRELRCLIGRARPVADEMILSEGEAWRRRLGVRRRVRLVSQDSPVAPFTTGVIHPTVFLPAAVLADPGLARVVLAHEMVHVARLDSLWMLIQQLIQCLYFFHPGVWFAGARLAHERERVCDATVLRMGTVNAKEYARRLLDVAALDLAQAEAPALRPRYGRLRSRVMSILDAERFTGGAPVSAVVCAAIAFFVLPLAGGGTLPESPERIQDEGPVVEDRGEPAETAAAISLSNPLPGARVSAPYGDWIHPFRGGKAFHRGIDLVQPAGTAIAAAAAGIVRVAEVEYSEEPAAGTVVIIDHGHGMSTYYAHLGDLEVEAGESVVQGQRIAVVGTTGLSTGPHLHFEVRLGDQPADPADHIEDWTR